MFKNKKTNKNAKVVISVCIILVIATVGIWLWQKPGGKTTPADSAEGNSINYSPPTDQEIKETEQNKKELEDRSHSGSGSNQPSNASANAILTRVSSTEASGYISNVFEDGGTCTIVITKGSTKVTASSTGFKDVNKTSCSPLNYSTLGSGDWSAVLSYNSSTISGSSAALPVKVP